MSEAMKRRAVNPAVGRPKSREWRRKAAERVKNGVAGFRLSKRGAYTDRKGRTYRMRSEWERETARWLDARGYGWEYEPEVISLPSGAAYLPDFRLSDGRFIEVKGYFSPEDRAKVAETRAMGYRVPVWTGPKLKRLGVLSE
jgi:hypothetical protein